MTTGDENRLTCPNGHLLFGHVTGGVCGRCGATFGEPPEAKTHPHEEPLILETKEHGRVVAHTGGPDPDPFPAEWSRR